MSIEAYKANLDEAGRAKNAEAAKVYGAWVRWNSDWNHWAERLRMAQREAGVAVTAPSSPGHVPEQQDMRLPLERDDEAPF